MKRKAKPFRCPCCGQKEGGWHKMSCYDPHRADDGHTVTAPYAMPPEWRDCGPTVDQCLAGPNAPALKTGFCK